MLFFYQ
jgi:hypothetical protein